MIIYNCDRVFIVIREILLGISIHLAHSESVPMPEECILTVFNQDSVLIRYDRELTKTLSTGP